MSTEKIELAKALSRYAHLGQKDKGGNDYYLHPLAVSDSVNTEREIIVALLHDVLEDTSISYEALSNLFGSVIADDVKTLTRLKSETYDEYINRIKKCPVPRTVKIADLNHNIDISRLQFPPTDEDIKRLDKYKKALSILRINSVTDDIHNEQK